MDLIINILTDSITYIASLLGRILKKKLPRRSDKKYKLEATNFVDQYLHGKLGDELIKAYLEYLLNGRTERLERLKSLKISSITLVIEISRPILNDLRIRLGDEPDYVFSMVKTLSPDEIKEVALVLAKILSIINAIHDGPEIKLYISVPTSLAFLLGQMVGLSHYKVKIYQYSDGKYQEISGISREELTKI